MEDIHIKDKDGLRIKASSNTLISNQLFYILASGHKTIVRGQTNVLIILEFRAFLLLTIN